MTEPAANPTGLREGRTDANLLCGAEEAPRRKFATGH